jgi:SMC interacting uncharacterized protein involved in chromosome segregation
VQSEVLFLPDYTFRSSVMGYNKSEVEEYIAAAERRASSRVEELSREIASLKKQNDELNELKNEQSSLLLGESDKAASLEAKLKESAVRGEQFESMYKAVSERIEIAEADLRRVRSEKEQGESVLGLLQRQILDMRHQNEDQLAEIREYEKQRALVAELELKAYKRAKEMEYTAGVSFERAKSELKSELELAEAAFSEFKVQASRLCQQGFAGLDSMRDSLNYFIARMTETGERLKHIKSLPDNFAFEYPESSGEKAESEPKPAEAPAVLAASAASAYRQRLPHLWPPSQRQLPWRLLHLRLPQYLSFSQYL